MNQSKTLPPQRAWFLGVAATVVILMFALVILPRLDPQASSLVGRQAPDFNLELLHGGEPGDRVRLSDLRGQVVVVDFWASWCKPCEEQAAIMQQLVSEVSGQDVYVLGVSTSDSVEDAGEFIRSHQTSYSVAFDEGNAIAGAFGVTVLPTVAVIDPMGNIAFLEPRIVGKRELMEIIGALGHP